MFRFWVSYAVLWFISHSLFPLKHQVLLLIAGGFMALVVVVGARQNWESMQPLKRQLALADDLDIRLTPYTRFGMSYTTNAAKAVAFEIRSIASVINYILCGGVILVLRSAARLRQLRRLKRIEVDGCAQVLVLLHRAVKRQSFAEIVEKLPEINAVKVFEDLRYIEGVLFLADEPPGLRLDPQLRSELDRLAHPG